MERSTVSFLFILSLVATSNAYIPPDLWGDSNSETINFWQNIGQLLTANGAPADHVLYYSEGSSPRMFMEEGGKMNFVIAKADTSIATVDTLYSLVMEVFGEEANLVDPIVHGAEDHYQHFYLPHCGSGITYVNGYNRVIYENAWPETDLHVYGGSTGQKMAIVVRPGGEPAEVQLRFSGQDSLNVNVNGTLKFYLRQEEIQLDQAVAYQVDGAGNIIPVPWSANYEADKNTGIVSFNFASYDGSMPLVFLIGRPPAQATLPGTLGLCWSTYLGGMGSDIALEMADRPSTGELFVGGATTSEIITYPNVPGQSYYTGGVVSYIVKFSDLDDIEYKVFWGGEAGTYTHPNGMVVKDLPTGGTVYIGGNTSSSQLLTQTSGSAHFEQGFTSIDNAGFLASFSTSSGLRNWATYLNSTDPNTGAGQLITLSSLDMDPDRNEIFVAGLMTGELAPPDAPPTPPFTYYAPVAAPMMGYVARFNVNDELGWYTYIPSDQQAEPIESCDVVVGSDRIYVVGTTGNAGLSRWNSVQPPGAYDAPFQGGLDFFLYEFHYDNLEYWATYFGGPGVDHAGADRTIFSQGVWATSAAITMHSQSNDLVITGSTTGGMPIIANGGWTLPGWNTGSDNTFIARFDGLTRSLVWTAALHGAPGTKIECATTAFNGTGDLFIAGLTNTPTAPPTQLFNGWYNATTPITNTDNGSFFSANDAFLMSFDQNNALLYGTFFGGAGGTGGERVRALHVRSTNNEMYFGGNTSKDVAAGMFASYFPLDDGMGTPYFEGIWQGAATEGFVASLCTEAGVGISETAAGQNALLAVLAPTGILAIPHVDERTKGLVITNSLGQVILEQRVLGKQQGPLEVVLPQLAPGAYSVTDGRQSAQFLILE